MESGLDNIDPLGKQGTKQVYLERTKTILGRDESGGPGHALR